MATAEDALSGDEVRSLESILAARLQKAARIVSSAPISDARSATPQRRFWRCEAVLDSALDAPASRFHGRDRLSLFVKRAPPTRRVRPFELDRYLSDKGYALPYFFGCNVDLTLAAWEMVEGRNVPFQEYTQAQLEIAIEAIAKINATTLGDDIPAAKGMRWVNPVVARLKKNAGVKPEYVSRLRRFGRIERAAIRDMTASGPIVLNHNDFSGGNIVLSEAGLWIVDWESASLGPAGASLRVFAEMPQKAQVAIARRYVHYMARFGVKVDLATVLFVMRGQQIFWALDTGARSNFPARVGWGLARAASHFEGAARERKGVSHE